MPLIPKRKEIIDAVKEGQNPAKAPNFSRPSAVFNLFRYIVRDMTHESDKDKEHFWVLGLNRKNGLKYIELVSLGSMTACVVHPREVYRTAILKGCASIICCHNHPSGDPEPSRDDIDVTHKLQDAGEILSVQMLDHIVIGYDSYISIFEVNPEFQNFMK